MFLLYYIRDRKTQREFERKKLESEERRDNRQIEADHQLAMAQAKDEKERQKRQEQLEVEMTERTVQENRRLSHQLDTFRRELLERQADLLKVTTEMQEEREALNSGGYIILELPDDLRSMFTDLLKGFEEFAKLKGYNISFSVDTSIPHKIAFKFTLQEGGISVSTQSVRRDIEEYIEKVQRGDSFHDLPVVISRAEHDLVSTTLRNRISFLQHNYNLEKNGREYYERVLSNISSFKGFGQQPSVIVQTGNMPKLLQAHNSNHIAQADNAFIEDNSNNADYSTLTISNSFNKKKEQVDKIAELIKLLRQDENINEDDRQTVITNFDKIREEIQEEENPSKQKIYKWLLNAKAVLETVVLAHHTTEAVKWVYENFTVLVEWARAL